MLAEKHWNVKSARPYYILNCYKMFRLFVSGAKYVYPGYAHLSCSLEWDLLCRLNLNFIQCGPKFASDLSSSFVRLSLNSLGMFDVRWSSVFFFVLFSGKNKHPLAVRIPSNAIENIWRLPASSSCFGCGALFASGKECLVDIKRWNIVLLVVDSISTKYLFRMSPPLKPFQSCLLGRCQRDHH